MPTYLLTLPDRAERLKLFGYRMKTPKNMCLWDHQWEKLLLPMKGFPEQDTLSAQQSTSSITDTENR